MPDGLEATLLAHRAPLVRFLRARGAGDAAEDLFQDLWIKVRDLAATGPIGDPIGYLYRMADNLMHDQHRSAVRRRRREEAYVSLDPANHDVGGPELERGLIARETIARVEAALDALGERTSVIFRRFRVDGVGQKTIAAEQGLSLSAVEKHLQRAYRAISSVSKKLDAEAREWNRPEDERADDAAE